MSVATGERPETAEIVVFGKYKHREVPVRLLVRMPQVRSGSNPDLPDIKESVRVHGLLNPIDIALVTKEQLAEYIDFTNALWGQETSIDDFGDQEVDDYYHLVIAGHTRTEAIEQLETEDAEGRTYAITSKIHDITDPGEIIALQLDENLHSKPVQERRAMAIVEAYMYGKIHGRWANEKEFLELNKGKFSKGVLQEAIGFARLPAEMRDFVLGGFLSYNAAVEIGRAAEPAIDNIVANFGIAPDDKGVITIPEELEAEVASALHKRMDIWISHIQARGLNSIAAKTYIKGQVAQLLAQTAELRGQNDEDALFSMASEGEQRREYLKALRKEVWEAHKMLASVVDHSADDILGLHERLAGMDAAEAKESLQRSRKRLLEELGQGGLDLSVA